MQEDVSPHFYCPECGQAAGLKSSQQLSYRRASCKAKAKPEAGGEHWKVSRTTKTRPDFKTDTSPMTHLTTVGTIVHQNNDFPFWPVFVSTKTGQRLQLHMWIVSCLSALVLCCLARASFDSLHFRMLRI